MRARWGLSLLALLWGCGGDDARPNTYDDTRAPEIEGHHARRVVGPLGDPIAANPLAGVFSIPMRVNGQSGPPMIIDTGSPMTFVTPGAYGGMGTAETTGTATLSTGSFSLEDVPVVWSQPFGFGADATGVLGVNVICQFTATWDWQRSRFFLGAVPTDVETEGDEVRLPFRLVGGGTARFSVNGPLVPIPATRIVVDVTIEGRPLRMLLDTGASFTAVREAFVNDLVTDGRRSLIIQSVVQGGVASSRVARVRGIDALGVRREGAVIVGYSASNLFALGAEAGGSVDGLLGVDFMNAWLTVIDYPAGVVRLRRYRDRAHAADLWTRVGVIAGRGSDGAVRVAEVFGGTDAATAGFAENEALLSIDGVPLDGRSDLEVDRMLRGAVGESRRVEGERHTATLTVTDLLALP